MAILGIQALHIWRIGLQKGLHKGQAKMLSMAWRLQFGIFGINYAKHPLEIVNNIITTWHMQVINALKKRGIKYLVVFNYQ